MKKGFTLIEVMVVLSIVALVAILSYSFFGDSIREAFEKRNLIALEKQIHSVETAFGRWRMNGGAKGVSSFNDQVNDVLVGKYLKQELFIPKEASYTKSFAGNEWYLELSSLDWDNDGKPDFFATHPLDSIDGDLCVQFNEKYTQWSNPLQLATALSDSATPGAFCAYGSNFVSDRHIYILLEKM